MQNVKKNVELTITFHSGYLHLYHAQSKNRRRCIADVEYLLANYIPAHHTLKTIERLSKFSCTVSKENRSQKPQYDINTLPQL